MASTKLLPRAGRERQVGRHAGRLPHAGGHPDASHPRGHVIAWTQRGAGRVIEVTVHVTGRGEE